MRTSIGRWLQLGKNLFGQHLSELDAPLVEGVDVPDGTLGEGDVLVVYNQCAKCGRGDLVCQDRCGRSVSEEGLVWDKVVWCTFSLDFFGGLSKHESFRLSEKVGSKHVLVYVALAWVVALCGQDEIGRDELGALVQQLEEGVLCVGGWLAEEDWASGVVDVFAVAGNGLTVGLHG